jgi:hypothetical protein
MLLPSAGPRVSWAAVTPGTTASWASGRFVVPFPRPARCAITAMTSRRREYFEDTAQAVAGLVSDRTAKR